MAVYNNFVIKQGQDWLEVIVWKKPDGTLVPIDGIANDGTGARLQIRQKYPTVSQIVAGSPYEATYTYGNLWLSLEKVNSEASQGIYVTISESKFRIFATGVNTAKIPAGIYVYDLEVILSGQTTRLLEGEITVTPQVTV